MIAKTTQCADIHYRQIAIPRSAEILFLPVSLSAVLLVLIFGDSRLFGSIDENSPELRYSLQCIFSLLLAWQFFYSGCEFAFGGDAR